MANAADYVGKAFSVGGPFRLALSVFSRNFWRMAALAVAVYLLLGGAAYVLGALGFGLFGLFLSAGLWIVAAAFLIAAYAELVIRQLTGEPSPFRQILGCAIRGLGGWTVTTAVLTAFAIGSAFVGFYYVGVEILASAGADSGFVIGAALIALAAPGLMVTVQLWAVVPATIVEHLGVPAGFARGLALTRGHRWRILALVLLAIVIVVTLEFLVIALPSSLFSAFRFGIRPIGSSVVFMLVLWGSQFLLMSLLTAFVSCLNAATYAELRTAKEGMPAIDRMASVFD